MTQLTWSDPPPPTRRVVYDVVMADVTQRPNTWAKVAVMPTSNAARNAKRRLLDRLGVSGRAREFEVRAVGCELFVRYKVDRA